MVRRHMPRRSVPRTWPIKRKLLNWIARPNSGANKMEDCMAVSTVLKEVLGLAKTSKEAKKILQDKSVLINKKAVKDLKAQVGFMDVLELPKLKQQYIVIFNQKGKLSLKEIKADEAKTKVCKVLSKRTIKGNKTQLGLSDGTTVLTDKKDQNPGDSVVLSLPDRKIKTALKLEKGATVYLSGGKNVGVVGKIETLTEGTGTKPAMVTVKAGKSTFETRKYYAYVIGKEIGIE